MLRHIDMIRCMHQLHLMEEEMCEGIGYLYTPSDKDSISQELYHYDKGRDSFYWNDDTAFPPPGFIEYLSHKKQFTTVLRELSVLPPMKKGFQGGVIYNKAKDSFSQSISSEPIKCGCPNLIQVSHYHDSNLRPSENHYHDSNDDIVFLPRDLIDADKDQPGYVTNLVTSENRVNDSKYDEKHFFNIDKDPDDRYIVAEPQLDITIDEES